MASDSCDVCHEPSCTQEQLDFEKLWAEEYPRALAENTRRARSARKRRWRARRELLLRVVTLGRVQPR